MESFFKNYTTAYIVFNFSLLFVFLITFFNRTVSFCFPFCRYGLPVNFQAMLLQPLKATKKLRETLNKIYSHLDSSLASGQIDVR